MNVKCAVVSYCTGLTYVAQGALEFLWSFGVICMWSIAKAVYDKSILTLRSKNKCANDYGRMM